MAAEGRFVLVGCPGVFQWQGSFPALSGYFAASARMAPMPEKVLSGATGIPAQDLPGQAIRSARPNLSS